MMIITVLLASNDGVVWLPEQVESILAQQGVHVRLVISDDCSSDGTLFWLQQLAARDDRVTLLPDAGPFGSAALNFYRLLREADFMDTDYIAFADQDDVWYPDKLIRAVELMRQCGAAAASSNVNAFWPDGRHELVDKAQPQKLYDYLFEAAGPGCTYVLTSAFAQTVRETVAQFALGDATSLPGHHDWLCYVLCRARGHKWVIDPKPSMNYRQHQRNEVGVNRGVRAARGRHAKIVSGWYRQQVLGMVALARSQSLSSRALAALALRLTRGQCVDRLILATQVLKFRRRWRDGLILAAYFISGLFWKGAEHHESARAATLRHNRRP
ncbi:glycosyltransferase [Hylemonella sp. W303a]|uniref:glycosyltransferase n=1 Tax=Hylemonella sp. W303a TaxID=3389873 RepID=UPI00396B3BDE